MVAGEQLNGGSEHQPACLAMPQADEIRAAADIVKIVGDFIKLRKAGANFLGLCPFHQEKTPSFAVHPVKQIFHCFGCGVGGDVFKFVMLAENVTFPEALRRVAEKIGVKIRDTGGATYDAHARERAVLQKVHEIAARFFAAQLSGTSEGRAARGYLSDRGLTDEVMARFRLGYAPSQGQALTRHLLDAGFEAADLAKSGLVLHEAQSSRHYDRFRRRIMFPIANESGKVIAFGGRALGDDQPKYLNSPETPIYSKSRTLYHLDRAASAIRRADVAVLVEGYMDCIAVEAAGIENVVASCGTSLTEAQVRMLARHSRRVVVNYDPDSAGVAATERSLALLLEEGCEARVLALPGGLDPDSFIGQRGKHEYRSRLEQAPGYLDYITDRALSVQDVSTPEGKIAAANSVMPHLARVPNPLLRVELADRLAERLHLDERLLREELKRAAAQAKREVRQQGDFRAAEISVIEKQLLRALLEDAALARRYLPMLMEHGVLEGLPSQTIFKTLFERVGQGEDPNIPALAAALNEGEQRLVFASAFWSTDLSPEQTELSYRALCRKKAERERDQLQAAIRDAESRNDNLRLAQLWKAKMELTKQLIKAKAN